MSPSVGCSRVADLMRAITVMALAGSLCACAPALPQQSARESSSVQSSYDYQCCALSSEAGRSCYFSSREQCMEWNFGGSTNVCVQNPAYRPPPPPPPPPPPSPSPAAAQRNGR